MTEERFDQILKDMREETVPAEQVAAACDRVRRQIAGSTSMACGEFRPEFGDYIAGRLTDSRRLLIDDHLGRCAECRRALAEAKGERRVVSMPRTSSARMPGWTRWAIAAGVAATALYLGRDNIDAALAPSGPRATVVSVSGALYRLPQSALQAGATLSERDVIRTTAGSHAIIQLADGSRVELNQRTELSVQAAWSGQTVRLDRGDVIVQAAKQRRGHLRVMTSDSIASVKGTVFAVSSGSAGSLVSVLEGSVAVTQPGSQRLLTAGKQAASTPALAEVPVRQAVAWSQDAEKYYALIGELIGIEKQLAQTPGPAPRTDARLLRYLPAGVMMYFAIPNLDGTIRQAVFLFDQRARENATLNEWWSSDQGKSLKQTLDHIQAITPLLGDEIVFTFSATGGIPLMLAQIQPGRQDALRQALDKIVADHPEQQIPYRITPDLLLVSDSAPHLATMAAQLGAGASSAFASEILSRYTRGVNWLAAVDAGVVKLDGDLGSVLGTQNLRYLFFEQRSPGGRDENEATLSFQGSRTGIASWLAAPGAAGTAEYVSSEAVVALSASTRDPRQALEELLAAIGQNGLATGIRNFESESGVSLVNDIASSLGTDFTVAVERPSLPVPGWIAAMEVTRPTLLDDAARRLVDAYNRKEGADHPEWKLTLTQETVNGRVWTAVKSGMAPTTLYWTYDRGYLIASTDRGLAARAITIRESGSSLVHSASFQQRFPTTNGLHHSGFFWLNTNGVLADLAGLVQSPAVKNLVGSREPFLLVLDGETERIHAASRTRLTSLILDAMLVPGPAKVGEHSLREYTTRH